MLATGSRPPACANERGKPTGTCQRQLEAHQQVMVMGGRPQEPVSDRQKAPAGTGDRH